MSAIQNVNMPITETEAKVAKPFLPAKYAKNLVFGYWLIENLKAKELIQDDVPALELIHLFAEVDTQKEFLNTFFEEQKMITKNMKALVRSHNKPTKKSAASKKAASASADAEAEPKRRGRKKVVKEGPVLSEQEQIISELVAAANQDDKKESAIAATNAFLAKNEVEPIVEAKKVVKEPKEKVVKEPKEKVVKEPKEKVVKEPKEKVAKEPKEKVAKEPKTPKTKKTVVAEKKEDVKVAVEDTEEYVERPGTPLLKRDDDEEEEEEGEIEATQFKFEGVEYLIDAKNTLYDPVTFSVFGHFDEKTLTVTKA